MINNILKAVGGDSNNKSTNPTPTPTVSAAAATALDVGENIAHTLIGGWLNFQEGKFGKMGAVGGGGGGSVGGRTYYSEDKLVCGIFVLMSDIVHVVHF